MEKIKLKSPKDVCDNQKDISLHGKENRLISLWVKLTATIRAIFIKFNF